MPHRVVDLGNVRDVLAAWDDARTRLAKGRIKGMMLCLKSSDGEETIYIAGDYQRDPELVARAAMRMSMEVEKRSPRLKR